MNMPRACAGGCLRHGLCFKESSPLRQVWTAAVGVAIQTGRVHFCRMQTEHSVVAHWSGDFDEARLQAWAEQLRSQLTAPQVSLGLVFLSPKFFPQAAPVLELLRVHARIPLLAGCSSQSLIAGDQELEENAGLVLGLYSVP